METQEKPRRPEAMMEIYKRLAVPGPEHKRLAALSGSWTTRTTAWMDGTGPDTPPVRSTGTCEMTMLLGGRYLQQVFCGDMLGVPFTGVNLVGFDNHTRKYVSAWIDSMSTGINLFEGAASADGTTITQTCSYDDPVMGPVRWRSVMTFVDADTLTYEMFITPRGGKEEKMMEMSVIRER